MSELQNEKITNTKWLEEYFGEEDYTDYPQWKDFILTWNKAQDAMGIKQTLWVLRFDFKWTKSLSCLHPEQYPKLLSLLRVKYHELVKRCRIKPQQKS